jgi:hypothetical protein
MLAASAARRKIMRTKLIVTAVFSVFATAASAGSFDTPYALSAIHQDFLLQLKDTVGESGEVGAAARAAISVLEPHIELEESVVLPFLGFAGNVAGGNASIIPEIPERLERLKAELPRLLDAESNGISTLVELYAVAASEGRPEIVQLAERMIWHETNDAEILYPAAVLVGHTAQASMVETTSGGTLRP